jgi:hypothetical protein
MTVGPTWLMEMAIFQYPTLLATLPIGIEQGGVGVAATMKLAGLRKLGL